MKYIHKQRTAFRETGYIRNVRKDISLSIWRVLAQ